MNPNIPFVAESSAEPVRYANYPPTVPGDRPSPADASESGTETPPESHKAHHLTHLLMCAPMLLVVGYLVLTGRAGGGSISYALGCMAMMGVMMMVMGRMGRGTGGGGSGPRH
ncbi:MAG TPA: hypothetical protein VGK53_12460 [Propionicimonas sp.]|jgi:hypothetical protein